MTQADVGVDGKIEEDGVTLEEETMNVERETQMNEVIPEERENLANRDKVDGVHVGGNIRKDRVTLAEEHIGRMKLD